MLAWIMNLGFAAGGLGVGHGPYRVAAGCVALAGAAAAQQAVAGAAAGQSFTCGSQAGQIHA